MINISRHCQPASAGQLDQANNYAGQLDRVASSVGVSFRGQECCRVASRPCLESEHSTSI